MPRKHPGIGATTREMSGNRRHKATPSQQRKIPRTRRSVSGVYAFRGEHGIPYESSLERDFIIRSDFSLDTLEIIAQPVTLEWVGANGVTYPYTPDYLVYRKISGREHSRRPKPLLVEVKYRDDWQKNWRGWRTKWKAAIRYAREQGWQFRIMDEVRVRDSAFERIRWLERFKRTVIDEKQSRRILNDLEDLGPTSFDLLVKRHFTDENTMLGTQQIWALLAQRYIGCDISRPLDHETKLWVATDA